MKWHFNQIRRRRRRQSQDHLISRWLPQRASRADHGLLASRYVFGFEDKWIRGGASDTWEQLSGDIQGLADLANTYSVVREMRIVPFSLRDVMLLGFTTALPLLPLVMTKYSPEQLLISLIKILLR